MTKMETLEMIEDFATSYGFEFYNKDGIDFGIKDPTGTINFAFTTHFNYLDFKDGSFTGRIEVWACIATMGTFDPTGDKLIEQAKVIEKAGELIKVLNDRKDMTYVETNE